MSSPKEEPKQQTAIMKIQNTLEFPTMRQAFHKALGNSAEVERYIQSVINTVVASEGKTDLQTCSPKSIAIAAVAAATLGLTLYPIDEAYLVPYVNKKKDAQGKEYKVREAQFAIGYKGYIKLALENGTVLKVKAEIVHENDYWEETCGTNESIIHRKNRENPGAFFLVYAVAKLSNGEESFVVLDKKDIQRHRAKAKTDYIWKDFFEEMCKKTAIRVLSKVLPMGRFSTASAMEGQIERGEKPAELGPVYDIPESDVRVYDEPNAVDAEIIEESAEKVTVVSSSGEPTVYVPPGMNATITHIGESEDDYSPDFGASKAPEEKPSMSARQARLITDFGKAITAKTSDTLWVNEQLKTKFGGLLPELSEDKLELAVAWAKGLKKA